MSIFEIFRKTESGSSEVGSFECGSDSLTKAFIDLTSMVGLSNPNSLVSTSPKGVSISKKGDKYIIKLLMFDPPVELEWSDLTPLNKLFNTLNSISEEEREVGSVSFKKLNTGHKFFQIALAK